MMCGTGIREWGRDLLLRRDPTHGMGHIQVPARRICSFCWESRWVVEKERRRDGYMRTFYDNGCKLDGHRCPLHPLI